MMEKIDGLSSLLQTPVCPVATQMLVSFSLLAVSLESFDDSSAEFLFPDWLSVDRRDDLKCTH